MIYVTSILIGHDEQLVGRVPAQIFSLDNRPYIQHVRLGQRIAISLVNEYCHSVKVTLEVLYKTSNGQMHVHRPFVDGFELELGPTHKGRFVTDVLPSCIVEYFIINHR